MRIPWTWITHPSITMVSAFDLLVTPPFCPQIVVDIFSNGEKFGLSTYFAADVSASLQL